MKCPHCDEQIPGTACPDCGEMNPETANYCMSCGAYVSRDADESMEGEDGFSLEDRVLCPDGTCTGIIIDGKCTDCGKSPSDHDEEPSDEVRENPEDHEKDGTE
ncbi:MAG: zinc ribbon domain-containing protein [Thermodesulfobacteriota bacterium]|nr:zinc ribbon domain-containing protein [Thermodesulfobacteriota bacterium]